MQLNPREVADDETRIKTSEVTSVAERAKALGLTVPDNEVLALPHRFFNASDISELTYEPNTANVKILLRSIGITLNTIQSGEVKIPFRDDRDDTWVTPVLSFTTGLIVRNPTFVKEMVEAISAYAMELFRGVVGRVQFTCAIEKTEEKKTVLITYSGPADKIADVTKHIEQLAK